jgi:hypothetical protein
MHMYDGITVWISRTLADFLQSSIFCNTISLGEKRVAEVRLDVYDTLQMTPDSKSIYFPNVNYPISAMSSKSPPPNLEF